MSKIRIYFNFDLEKKTLVFDLDETLIRSEFMIKEGYDYKISIRSRVYWESRATVYLFVRPYLLKMLAILKEDFELIIFTASEGKYAAKILNCID